MGTTIYDIAKKAGVSTCWVSYVLRNHPLAQKVSPQVRERIKAVASELNYRPNLSAVTISNGFNNSTIAMIVPGGDGDNSMDYMHSQYFRIIRFFNDHGYGVRIYCGDKIEEIFREILSNQIRYVFINLIDPKKCTFCAEISRKNKLKSAFRGIQGLKIPDFPCFASNDLAVSKSAVQHLIQKGHTRIAGIFGTFDAQYNKVRHEGWLTALKESEISKCSSMCIHGDGFSDEAFLELLRKYRPTAVYAADATIAVRILQFCSFYRIPVPQAFSLVAHNYYDNRFFSPFAIAGVEQESIMTQIEESVLAYFEGRISESASFSGKFIPGESTATPSDDLSWLDQLPESFENDRKWFPNNNYFEKKKGKK